MSRKRARTLHETANDPKYGRHFTTMYFDSDDAKNPLSRSQNQLRFKVQRTVEQVASLKIREVIMTNTVCPFQGAYSAFKILVGGSGYVDPTEYKEYTIDLGSAQQDLAFTRQNLDELGPVINAQITAQRAGTPSAIFYATAYDSKTDSLVMTMQMTTSLGATPVPPSSLGLYAHFDMPSDTDLTNETLIEIFGMSPPGTDLKYNDDPQDLTGAAYKKVLGSYTYVGAVVPPSGGVDEVISNAALRLEGNNNLIMKLNALKTRSTHSYDERFDVDPTKLAVKASNIVEKINLGPTRGNIVRYNNEDFPHTFYKGAGSLSGEIIFSFYTPYGGIPSFQKGTPVQITLDVEYDDD